MSITRLGSKLKQPTVEKLQEIVTENCLSLLVVIKYCEKGFLFHTCLQSNNHRSTPQ